MVTKKLATRLEKKREELDTATAKAATLRNEVADLEREAQLELFTQLQSQLGTDDLAAVETFIAGVKPVAGDAHVDMPQPQTHQGGGF